MTFLSLRTATLEAFLEPLTHPIPALLIFEIPLILGLRPDNPWCIPGAVLLLVTLVREWRAGPRAEWLRLFDRRVLRFLWILFIAAWAVLIPIKYFGVGYGIFDTGIYAAALHLFFHTGRYWSSILQLSELRNHFTPNLLLVSPLLFAEWSFVMLHVLKLLAFVASAFVLWRLSKRILGPESRFEWAIPTLWLVHSLVGRTLDFEFQPSALALPFILLAFLFAIESRRFLLVCTLVLLLGFKEHLSLVWICVGIFLLLENPRDLLASGLVLLGCVIGPVLYTQVMPLFDAGTPAHAARWGPFELMPGKALLIARAIFSVGCLPLLAPRTILWVLPAFGLALMSRDPQMVSFGFHYQDMPLTILFVAALFGLRNLEGARVPLFIRRPALKSQFIVLMISSLILSNTWFPFRSIRRHLPTRNSIRIVKNLRDVRQRIRPSCTLWVLNCLGPYLYQLPDLRMIHSSDQNFDQRDVIVVIARGVSAWPLKNVELDRLRGRLDRSSRFQKQNKYRGIEVYSSESCLVGQLVPKGSGAEHYGAEAEARTKL